MLTKVSRTPLGLYTEHNSWRSTAKTKRRKPTAACLQFMGGFPARLSVQHRNKKLRVVPPAGSSHPYPLRGTRPRQERLWPVGLASWPVMWQTEHCSRIWGGTSGKSLSTSEPRFLHLQSEGSHLMGFLCRMNEIMDRTALCREHG